MISIIGLDIGGTLSKICYLLNEDHKDDIPHEEKIVCKSFLI
jgi:hypothetical protein